MSGILHTEDGADRRHHVVVIGSGFGGLTAAKALILNPWTVGRW